MLSGDRDRKGIPESRRLVLQRESSGNQLLVHGITISLHFEPNRGLTG